MEIRGVWYVYTIYDLSEWVFHTFHFKLVFQNSRKTGDRTGLATDRSTTPTTPKLSKTNPDNFTYKLNYLTLCLKIISDVLVLLRVTES